MSGHGLSKSRIIAWKQCPRRLWLETYRRELLAISGDMQQTFEIGFEVGEVARRIYPNGILIEGELSAALQATKYALKTAPELPLFEATFQYDGLLVRSDLLIPKKHGYCMTEVKASASVKAYHLEDCTIQAWVLVQNGIALQDIEIAHIDTAFVYQGNGNYQGLFNVENVTEVIQAQIHFVPGWINDARTTLSHREPNIEPGPQCNAPFECPFKSYCCKENSKVPEPVYPLDILYRMSSAKKDELRASGVEDALQVPPSDLNLTQQWIQGVSQLGVADLRPHAKEVLARFAYPRYYLDFETISLAVPRWQATRPYVTQVPFQWSCHVEDSCHCLTHAMFLDVSGNDPRRNCAEQMLAVLGTTGPIFVYFESFEKSRITELAALFPDLAESLLAVNARIVDLLPITRVNYYHPDMQGSWSIKAVLPTIAPDLRYDLLTVGNGGDAQVAFREILHPNTAVKRRQELTVGLTEYCTLDTLAMVRLAWFLQGISTNHTQIER